MAADRDGLLQRLLDRLSQRRWKRAAAKAPATRLSVLRKRRRTARGLRLQLERFLHVAEGRLALPAAGTAPVPRVAGSEWVWRPDYWQGPITPAGQVGVLANAAIGGGITVFHDCPRSEVTIRQLRNHRTADLAAYGLHCDVLGFEGSYLSLAIGLPEEAARAMSRQHVVRLDTIIEHEHPLWIQARLNIQHGPNTEQIRQQLALDGPEVAAEFDLAYTDLNEKRITNAWVDLLVDGAAHNRLVLRDVTISRRRRAQL